MGFYDHAGIKGHDLGITQERHPERDVKGDKEKTESKREKKVYVCAHACSCIHTHGGMIRGLGDREKRLFPPVQIRNSAQSLLPPP